MKSAGASTRLKDEVFGGDFFAIPRGARAAARAPSASAVWRDARPIEGELFSPERLEEHARTAAAGHAIAAGAPRHRALGKRLSDNADALREAYQALARAAAAREPVSPTCEWLIDNYHVAERQIRDIRVDLPAGFYRRLSKLAAGALAGYPRILAAAWDYVAHTGSRFEPNTLVRYVRAYQDVQPLSIGELWAVPITLRILLVENLRRTAAAALAARAARMRAAASAARLLNAAVAGAEDLSRELAAMRAERLDNAFVVELAMRLRDQDPSVAPALDWLDQRMAFERTTVDAAVLAEQQREISSTILVRNIITSMRFVTDVDWRDLFERMSLVDDVLSGVEGYARMDFPTRNLYRTAIEEIARGAEHSEIEIALGAVAAAAEAPNSADPADARFADPGYYLIGAGRAAFERAVGYVPPLGAWPGRLVRTLGIAGYVGAGTLVSAALLSLPLGLMAAAGFDWRWIAVLAALGAIPAIDAAVCLINHAITRGLKATLLPSLELTRGVPEDLRTLVVVPMMLTSRAAIAEQIEGLEVHYLSSPKGEVYFALLSDWTDADAERAEGDEELAEAAASGIAALNRRHPTEDPCERFFLLHRKRVWSDSERKWIGWERKRGKLSELNDLLRGSSSTTFIPIAGKAPSAPPNVRYVITLDADTRLTPEAVSRLIGKMAHPLNAPRFDPARGRVVEGYAILQPRVTPAMPAESNATPFLAVFSSFTGIDPYAAAASDVYQDLLGEGSYTGKGIYDVDAFRAALAGRVPPASLLSHDLYEGALARSALVSDVEFVEEFPARYDIAALRHHRWTRGDWQLLPWILGLTGGVSLIGRFKMLDNLRRSVSAPAAVAALLAGFALPAPASLAWTVFVLATLAVPPFVPVIASAPHWRSNSLTHHVRSLGVDLKSASAQWLLSITLLAHQSWLMSDAVLRTLVRLATRRKLLEWTPAAQAAFGRRADLVSYYAAMAGALAVAAASAAIALLAPSAALAAPIALALLWGASPAIALWTSRPQREPRQSRLSASDAAQLRIVARKTWRFFETFVTGEHNALPPDNYQETPKPVTARRTSPTNIGLYLLSTVAAHHLGWIARAEAAERLEATLATLDTLERHRGHFYNWYDTETLRPLEPRYVSSVDSGNLAGHLLAVAQACLAWKDAAPSPCFDAEALAIAREEARKLAAERRMAAIAWPAVDEALQDLVRDITACRGSYLDHGAGFREWRRAIDSLIDMVEPYALGESEARGENLLYWLGKASACIDRQASEFSAGADEGLPQRLEMLAQRLRALALEMDFTFLVDPDRLLLSIGYREQDGVLDPSCYDLVASEARLASLVAIAKGDAPAKHWFRLSHALAPTSHGAVLVSWSGSMFEYLMPALVMAEPPESLIGRTNRLVVKRQVEYGRARGVPWGVSESAYNARDLDLTYQYSNFGVPGLGLKRGLAESLVVSPYSTALAAMFAPAPAAANFERLAQLDALGRFGFYEAIDFTPERVRSGAQAEIVRAYMAHHQGMTIAAIANTVSNGALRSWFHAEPLVRAFDLLLQERAPREAHEPPAFASLRSAEEAPAREGAAPRRSPSPFSASPATHLLSNSRYTVMTTAAGSGFSTWKGMAITRWREDATRDDWGAYFYLRDVENGAVWSPSLQPLCYREHAHSVSFAEEKAEFSCDAEGLLTQLDVIVSEEDDAEVRRVTICNCSDRPREVEVTSYMELALARPEADSAHPAFSKLFIETEHVARAGALLATRRRRDPDEPEIWAAHLAVVEGASIGGREFETDRAKFLGRGRDVRGPIAVTSGSPLSGAVGATLDPIFSLRRRVRIAPGETQRIHFWTMAAASRDAALQLVDRHNDAAAFERAAALAWTQAQVELHHLDIDRQTAALYQSLAGHLIYANPAMRPAADQVASGRGEQSLLWSLGISGDLPILLVSLTEPQEIGIVREALKANEYLRTKRLAADLVILNARGASYQQDLQAAIESTVRAAQARPRIGAGLPAGQIYLLRADLVAPEARALLAASARVVLHGERGSIAQQLHRRPETEHHGVRGPAPSAATAFFGARPRAPQLEYFNGFGGFAEDGSEYVVTLAPGLATPAPWINVVANQSFGFHVSETGAGFTWSQNSRERQLTPWTNDPVSDASGEAFYIRDRDTGEVLCPTASPMRIEAASYVIRHGRGYSRFECEAQGLKLGLIQYVPLADPIKIARLSIVNASDRARRLSATAYVEWVLGASRSAAQPFIVTERDDATGAVLASNRWRAAFKERIAFADLAGAENWTGDRREFIGRNGSLASPAAIMEGAELSGRLGAGLDPCTALETSFELAPGQSVELVFLLGDAASAAEARALIARYRSADLDAVLNAVKDFWRETLGAVEVKTPDRSFDLMMNGWLLYQTLACRIWARAGFYQASGAYGFRDQLQDVMALATARPEIGRAHILAAAAHQFEEGDVQHWWLPETGQGVRTRISDDRLWLAHAAAHHVKTTGDAALLDEDAPFLRGATLREGETEAFFRPDHAQERASLYEHCARALDASLEMGPHGLPLIGGGDWNDGFNRVGRGGRGESVWLGWFLHSVLADFAPIAQSRGDGARAARWRDAMNTLTAALEREAWDGDWYRRGWYDDGAPLGSAASEECRLDSIAQSWALLSRAGDPERARRAMAAVERDLIRANDNIALLFAPPFDTSAPDPGYIKGYPPGVRENGGQYTHAAAWSVMALATLGEGDKAAGLFWMLNPINHARTRADAHRYRTEPYAVAADIYAAPGHVGRGGWSWYTGSAGLLYRAGLESILGVVLDGAHLCIDPCIPASWPGFSLTLRWRSARYEIFVENPDGVSRGVASAALDGVRLSIDPVLAPIVDDGSVHRLDIVLGEASAIRAAPPRVPPARRR
ncbi:MAG: glycosyl transferase [Alphaproteobacteria bacterium]|nr:MAG: glycosyl transferase [Alphaproteobacteria bacterium]